MENNNTYTATTVRFSPEGEKLEEVRDFPSDWNGFKEASKFVEGADEYAIWYEGMIIDFSKQEPRYNIGMTNTTEQTIEQNQYGTFSVYGFGEWPQGSVLEGQTMKCFLGRYDTVEEAKSDHPEAEEGYRDAHNHFDHLSDEYQEHRYNNRVEINLTQYIL